MNKYNEIMNRITVDPEMKSRVMNAVSEAIKEQAEEKAVVTEIPKKTESETRARKKDKRPIVIISSIAAGVLVLAGVVFVFGKLGFSTAARPMDTIAAHNEAVETHSGENATIANEIDAVTGGEYYAEETTEEAEDGGNVNYYSSTTAKDVTIETASDDTLGVDGGDRKADLTDDEGMGDERLDKINKTLPFDLMGSGTGEYKDGITKEVFFGEDGQKVVLLSAPEGTDILKEFAPAFKELGTAGITPAGTAVTLYRVPFINVKPLEDGQTSAEVNAAVFTRDGKTYLLIFSEAMSTDVILNVIDVL